MRGSSFAVSSTRCRSERPVGVRRGCWWWHRSGADRKLGNARSLSSGVMYINERPTVGEYGEGSELGVSPGLSMAVAVPIGVGIAIGEVLEIIALVLAAIAAAYLLIKAYEAAKARGFGVALAQQMLSAGLGRLLSGA